jgi:hypothetical protein
LEREKYEDKENEERHQLLKYGRGDDEELLLACSSFT